MFGMEMMRRQLAKEEMEEIGSWLVGQSMRFAADVNGRFKEVPPLLAATEGVSFFLHALRRQAFRSHEWKAWTSIFEPSLKQTIQLFAMTLSAWSGADLDREALARDIQNLVSSRSLEFQTVPFLAGPPEDRQTVVWSASRRIADAIDPVHRDAVIAYVHETYGRIVENELPEQVAKLEKLLYGRRAA
jgi:hypothetical protein